MQGIAITGASSGLGYALAQFMLYAGWKVANLSLEAPPEERQFADRIKWFATDVRDWGMVSMAAEDAMVWNREPIRALVNCAAVNRISWLEDATVEDWNLVMDTNARGIFNTAKAFLPQLKVVQPYGVICNIVSDAAWKPMSGSSAYNASKGAAHILTLQLARELTRRHGITVFGIAPGKIYGTGMSQYIDRRVMEMRGWTKEEADNYAMAGRLHKEEIPVKALAEFISYLLGSHLHHRYLSGCILPYGA
jgi:NAD(P)-dependent dehydrogenase (short-subunit alcohol dehydrogenase family)